MNYVLVIDLDAPVVRSLAWDLASSAVPVLAAATEEEGARALREKQVELVVINARAPAETRARLAEEARACSPSAKVVEMLPPGESPTPGVDGHVNPGVWKSVWRGLGAPAGNDEWSGGPAVRPEIRWGL